MILSLSNAFSLVPLFMVPTLEADLIAVARADRDSVLLSEKVRLTLTVEGPAPLRIEFPSGLLSADSSASWRIQPAAQAVIESLPQGRERWSREYRLDPYPPLGLSRITFTPWTINGRTVEWNPIEIKVRTSVTDPRPEAARPVTGLEELPVEPERDPANAREVIGIVIGVVILIMASCLILLRRRRGVEPTPSEWAEAELLRLERDPAQSHPTELARIVRGYLSRRLAIPAMEMTSAELLASPALVGKTARLGRLLGEFDLLRFAGLKPDAAASQELISQTRAWLAAFDADGS